MLLRLCLRKLIALLAGVLIAAGSLGASPIACAPLILPDGHTITGPCRDDSWFPEPPWWYLPPTPTEPPPLPPYVYISGPADPEPPWWYLPPTPTEPPSLPPYAYIPGPGYPQPPSQFFLFVYEPSWTPPDPDVPPPVYSLWLDSTGFLEPEPAHAPEPAGLALLGLGLLLLGILGRWRKGPPLK